MAACRIVNANVVSAVGEIQTAEQKYRELGENFVNSLNGAIADMQGAGKDAFKEFIDTKVKPFVAEQLPDAIKGMGDLLEANRKNFEDVDKQIADSIK